MCLVEHMQCPHMHTLSLDWELRLKINPLWFWVGCWSSFAWYSFCECSQIYFHYNWFFFPPLGLAILKHVLTPRVKATHVAIDTMKDYLDAVYDVTVAYEGTVDHKGQRKLAPSMTGECCSHMFVNTLNQFQVLYNAAKIISTVLQPSYHTLVGQCSLVTKLYNSYL